MRYNSIFTTLMGALPQQPSAEVLSRTRIEYLDDDDDGVDEAGDLRPEIDPTRDGTEQSFAISSAEPLAPKPRKRRNRKPPKANNIYGRGGTLGCRACRNRKSKVIFLRDF
jgi:hypothetical protein